jgi:hypothetical protein
MSLSLHSITMWRWQRSKIPSDIKNGAPRPKTWGTPVSSFDGSTCDTRAFFAWQLLTFDITMCGDWAGIQSVWQDQWQTGSCYPKYATCAHANADPAALSEAYFEVNYIKGKLSCIVTPRTLLILLLSQHFRFRRFSYHNLSHLFGHFVRAHQFALGIFG